MGHMDANVLSLRQVLDGADTALRQGRSAAAAVTPTGFEPLDTYLSGGLRSGELTLLGGPQGLGKTALVLQMLRNIAAAGGSGIYVSYEHDAPTILERLIAAEAAEKLGQDAIPLRRIRDAMEAVDGRLGSLNERLASVAGAAEAVQAVESYGDRLFIMRASGASTTSQDIGAFAEQVRSQVSSPPVLVVDYLQKVAVPGGPDREEERVTIVVEALKDLALAADIPVLAVVAADKEGIGEGKRLRIHNLRGSTALAYEADVVLLLNDKYDVVARHHLVYDVTNAERFRDYAVLTLAKNRSGLAGLDLEFRKRFEHGRFEPQGREVVEQLVDERVFTE
jgi:replicative DNA helicase